MNVVIVVERTLDQEFTSTPKRRTDSSWEHGTSLWTHLDLVDTPWRDSVPEPWQWEVRYLRECDGVALFSKRRFIAADDGRVEEVDVVDERRGAIPVLEIERLVNEQRFELGQ